ncbi:hypothetical protein [Streptomyces sp. NRRL S-920]|uniref:hypothetical protein n=1 Tax=Streptomyces sp. NRRL S-920 TaxID=1463921 RepID=UPI0004C87906|nr:hypothetical protein [Streptomyces sp. NRRL S-920]
MVHAGATGALVLLARSFLCRQPRLLPLVAAALIDLPITPDARAAGPRKVGTADSWRRRSMRSV